MRVTREQRDANKTAAKIEKEQDLYKRCSIFKSMVDSTIWLSDDEIHQSMTVVGGDLMRGCGLSESYFVATSGSIPVFN